MSSNKFEANNSNHVPNRFWIKTLGGVAALAFVGVGYHVTTLEGERPTLTERTEVTVPTTTTIAPSETLCVIEPSPESEGGLVSNDPECIPEYPPFEEGE